MADKLHRFGLGHVSEQLMGQALDEDTVGMLADNETQICEYLDDSISISCSVFEIYAPN